MIVHHGGVPAVHLNLLRNRPEIVVDSSEVAITHYLLFNAARRPFNERGCRACFDRLVDRTEIVERILQGAGTPARDFLVEKAYRWNRGRFSPRADSSGDALRRLAACTAGKPLVLLLNQSDTGAWTYRHLADYLADYFTRRGIAIRVEALESGAWQAATDAGRFDLALYPLSAPTGTPELLIRRLAYSRGLPARSASNTTHFSSPSLDRLFEEAVYAPTAGEHERRFNQLLDLLAEEKPFVPLYHERYFYAYRRGFTEVQVDPFLKLDLARLRASGPFR